MSISTRVNKSTFSKHFLTLFLLNSSNRHSFIKQLGYLTSASAASTSVRCTPSSKRLHPLLQRVYGVHLQANAFIRRFNECMVYTFKQTPRRGEVYDFRSSSSSFFYKMKDQIDIFVSVSTDEVNVMRAVLTCLQQCKKQSV